MQPHLLRAGIQHRVTARQHLPQHVLVWSARDSRLRRLDTDGGPETNGSTMDRMRRADRCLRLQPSLYPDDPAQSV